jgi:Neuraminidase (sialidase)
VAALTARAQRQVAGFNLFGALHHTPRQRIERRRLASGLLRALGSQMAAQNAPALVDGKEHGAPHADGAPRRAEGEEHLVYAAHAVRVGNDLDHAQER